MVLIAPQLITLTLRRMRCACGAQEAFPLASSLSVTRPSLLPQPSAYARALGRAPAPARKLVHMPLPVPTSVPMPAPQPTAHAHTSARANARLCWRERRGSTEGDCGINPDEIKAH